MYLKIVLSYLLTKNVTRREFFPYILRWKRLNNIGAEIGTWQGYYSDKILERSSLKTLFSIDPWESYSYMSDKKEQKSNYIKTKNCLAKYGHRSEILKIIRLPNSKHIVRKNHWNFIKS